MSYFPFMIELQNKKCVIGGGGAVAARKVETMLEFGAVVMVVAPQIVPEILALQNVWNLEKKRLFLKEAPIEKEDLLDADLAIMATDDAVLNSRMAAFCREKGILVNVVDVKEECDFYFPAIIKQEDVVIAVSTGGESPLLAARMKKQLQDSLQKNYGEIARLLGEVREMVLEKFEQPEQRKRIFAKLIDTAMEADGDISKKEMIQIIEEGMESNKRIRIGTRGSRLAVAQTDMVIEALRRRYPDCVFEKVILSTRGDRQLDRPLLEFGGKAVFVEEFEDAIRDGRIDMAVHSAKDLPGELGENLTIAGVLPRADVRDVLIFPRHGAFEQYLEEDSQAGTHREQKFLVGTSSLRRQYQLENRYQDILCKPLRGNVNTRLQQLRMQQYDAIVLAAAGIQRIGLDREPDLSYRYLPCEQVLPAACQAIIAIETRQDGVAYEMAKTICDERAMKQFLTERRVLSLLHADCHEPVGVYADYVGETLRLSLMQMKQGKVVKTSVSGSEKEWEQLAQQLVR